MQEAPRLRHESGITLDFLFAIMEKGIGSKSARPKGKGGVVL